MSRKGPCPVCVHPERGRIQEAIDQAKPYREISARFKVPIGAMRRHRAGCVVSPTDAGGAPATSEEVFLRLGAAPASGRSYDGLSGYLEEGLAVFEGRKTKQGREEWYVFEIPESYEFAPLASLLAQLLAQGRPLYEVVGGTLADGVGSGGEPLLFDAVLKPVPVFTRVELPAWLGEEGERLAAGWNRWRRRGPRTGQPATGVPELVEAAARVTVKVDNTFELGTFDDPTEHLRAARDALRMGVGLKKNTLRRS